MDDFNDSSIHSRVEQRTKRRKVNTILNSLIAVVTILIIIVASFIFGGNKEEEKLEDELTNQQVTSDDELNNKDTDDQAVLDNENNSDNGTEQGGVVENKDDNNEIVEEASTNPNVRKTIINPAWQAVGTEQTGEHVTVFETSSLDWAEMEMALSYATNIPIDNLKTWFIRNGGYDKAIGTVSSNNDDQAYRVYIEWVDGQGWKPTKVEELIENDKGMTN